MVSGKAVLVASQLVPRSWNSFLRVEILVGEGEVVGIWITMIGWSLWWQALRAAVRSALALVKAVASLALIAVSSVASGGLTVEAIIAGIGRLSVGRSGRSALRLSRPRRSL